VIPDRNPETHRGAAAGQRQAKSSPAVQYAFKVAALALGLLLAAIIGEIGLRLLRSENLGSSGQERDFFCRFDRTLGWSPLENVTGLHANQGRTAVVHQNQFGLRGPDDMQCARADGRRRVLVLGDSYVWGYGVNQNKIFSAPEVHQTRQELLNFGVSGYGTDQEYLWYLNRGTNFRVDEVVVAFNPYNDVANNLGSRQYGYLKPFFTLAGETLVLNTNHIRDSLLRDLRGSLSRHSRLYSFLGEVIRGMSYRFETQKRSDGTAEAKAVELSSREVTERDRQGVELTVAILKKIRDAAHAQGAKFSVVFIPYKPHLTRRMPANHPLVPLIAEGLTRAGIDYVEPYPQFLAAAVAGNEVFNGPDNHFGPEGHALFARVLTATNEPVPGLNYYAQNH
jgi:hypothetical protein